MTDGWQMRQALRAFRDSGGADINIQAESMSLLFSPTEGIYRGLPSDSGASSFRQVMREVLGLLAGA